MLATRQACRLSRYVRALCVVAPNSFIWSDERVMGHLQRIHVLAQAARWSPWMGDECNPRRHPAAPAVTHDLWDQAVGDDPSAGRFALRLSSAASIHEVLRFTWLVPAPPGAPAACTRLQMRTGCSFRTHTHSNCGMHMAFSCIDLVPTLISSRHRVHPCLCMLDGWPAPLICACCGEACWTVVHRRDRVWMSLCSQSHVPVLYATAHEL